LKRNLLSSEESTWDTTLESDDPDVFEYLKNEKNKLETQVTNEFKKSDNLLNVKTEPSNENNINLLNVKTFSS